VENRSISTSLESNVFLGTVQYSPKMKTIYRTKNGLHAVRKPTRL